MDACCVYVDSILHLLLHVCLMCVVTSTLGWCALHCSHLLRGATPRLTETGMTREPLHLQIPKAV